MNENIATACHSGVRATRNAQRRFGVETFNNVIVVAVCINYRVVVWIINSKNTVALKRNDIITNVSIYSVIGIPDFDGIVACSFVNV